MIEIDFRALCAELVSRWDNANGDHDLCGLADIMDRARSALAQPPAAGPTEADFRALCAELLPPLAEYDDANPYHDYHELIRRAETALDQPPAAGPTDEQVADLAEQYNGDPVPAIRRALELWGRPAAVPVSERPWEHDGFCDTEGRCWYSSHAVAGPYWHLWPQQKWLPQEGGYCLPHWALPLPQPHPPEQQR